MFLYTRAHIAFSLFLSFIVFPCSLILLATAWGEKHDIFQETHPSYIIMCLSLKAAVWTDRMLFYLYVLYMYAKLLCA